MLSLFAYNTLLKPQVDLNHSFIIKLIKSLNSNGSQKNPNKRESGEDLSKQHRHVHSSSRLSCTICGPHVAHSSPLVGLASGEPKKFGPRKVLFCIFWVQNFGIYKKPLMSYILLKQPQSHGLPQFLGTAWAHSLRQNHQSLDLPFRPT